MLPAGVTAFLNAETVIFLEPVTAVLLEPERETFLEPPIDVFFDDAEEFLVLVILGSFLDLLDSEVETFNSFLLGRSLNMRRDFGESNLFDDCDDRMILSK